MKISTLIYDKIISIPKNYFKINFFMPINKSLLYMLLLLPVYLGLHENFLDNSWQHNSVCKGTCHRGQRHQNPHGRQREAIPQSGTLPWHSLPHINTKLNK